MLRNIPNEFLRPSSLLRIGAVVFGLGSALDLVYHASPPAFAAWLEGFAGPDAERVHLVIMAGMALIVLGLLAEGIKQPVRRRLAARGTGKEARQEL